MQQREMININANLVDDVKTTEFHSGDNKVMVANFTLVKKYGSGKEYTNCSVYGDKVEIAKNLKKSDFVHVYGYFKEVQKDEKTYRNFIVKYLNKIENTEKNKEEK